MNNYEEVLKDLYRTWSSTPASSVEGLPASGSYRKYYRITGKKGNAIGVLNGDAKENLAFLAFTRHFLKIGLPVPEIYAVDVDRNAYMIQDLGDLTLFGMLSRKRKSRDDFPDDVLEMYRNALHWLPIFQVKAGADLDYSLCYPRAAFDRQSMHWDLNYFKYYFLKLAKIPFDEQKLEDDFNVLMDFLLRADDRYFMYRDFQSRNIMISDNLYFIDYQGGRKGPLQYDVASLLYDGKADIPQKIREDLLDEYLEKLEEQVRVNRDEFIKYYYGFVLIRIIQALGAYGFRGYYEKKPHFLQSIPFALENISFLLGSGRISLKMPELTGMLQQLIINPAFIHFSKSANNLKVTINSFSYKDEIPDDESGNGGGFVFDCRALPNPGRNDEYSRMTGKDQPVIDFLKKEPAVDEFLVNAFSLVDQSVRNYIDRDFTSLMVSFGCTGGRHRSVFCTEELARHLREKFGTEIRINHKNIPQ